ncbi:hypothetical protein [Arsenicibacter rosenii]|uniref:Uncharacterized protein n=1 Tax=Arsenicibacter rosenii TaxID=1750698 RepID=A0A1S2VQQ5_9BACT|nr:hypothetical protein [Arsenicibacter rosenii]OIN61101.1 hypothetical protein BLX24_03270 [Arsenicibacter rosenii]
MTTAQILFEQYKVLPSRVKRELKEMIIQEEAEDIVPLKDQIKEGLKEIKLIKQGKLKARTLDQVLTELEDEA